MASWAYDSPEVPYDSPLAAYDGEFDGGGPAVVTHPGPTTTLWLAAVLGWSAGEVVGWSMGVSPPWSASVEQ